MPAVESAGRSTTDCSRRGRHPSSLNRAVPLAEVAGPAAALAEVETLESGGELDGYQYLPAVKADLLLASAAGPRPPPRTSGRWH